MFADSLLVDAGASATGTILTSDGSDVVSGTARDTVVSASGVENVASGGSTISAKVLNGGTENLAAGATGSALTVSFGGLLNGPGVLFDANTAAGTVRGVTVGAAFGIDTLEMLSGGVASSVTVIDVDDVLTVDVGATATGTVVRSNASDIVFGSATGTVVSASGVENVSSGGVASSSLISSGGQQVVFAGGRGVHAQILDGGLETLSGGSASVASVGNGGVLKVSSGGVASSAEIFNGGTDGVYSGGVGRGTVLSGGREFVYGVTSGTLVSSGGHEVVELHGTASGAEIGIGGLITVMSGGAISGGLKLFGGSAVISGTAVAGQTVAFVGATAVLELDNLASFAAKISGMSQATQQVDLGGFTFTASESATWAQSGTSGTLTVTDGAKVAHLTLIGTYTSNSFHLSTDGHGGTFVDDPPTRAAAPAVAAGFVQAIASLAGDYTAYVHSGGEAAVIASPAFLTAATSGR